MHVNSIKINFRNTPRAVAIVLPSKQPELSVATTTNEAFEPEAGAPEASSWSGNPGNELSEQENNFTGEYASLMILLGWLI